MVSPGNRVFLLISFKVIFQMRVLWRQRSHLVFHFLLLDVDGKFSSKKRN
jgi:hypothetical protein